MKTSKIPSSQTLWETHYKNGLPYRVVTSDITRTKWYLYDVSSDTAVKLATGKSPNEFKTNGRVKI